MFLMPLPFLVMWLTGLLSLALAGGGLYILWAWYVGKLVAAAWLVTSIAMLLWSALGRFVVQAFYPAGDDEPRRTRTGQARRLGAPDGSELHVEIYGPSDAPPIVLTHGWALDSTAWYYAKKGLADRFRLILWDLPGLGRSTQPGDGVYGIERFAEDLRTVLGLAGGRPTLLVGHSIGGMTILTFCRLFPQTLGTEVAGIVLMNTTYTQPLNTVVAGPLLRALQKPLIEPLLHLTIWLWPVVWLMNVQSYLNGSTHIVNRWTSFSAGVTRGQLDFASWFTVKENPSVVAKGLLATLRWDETATLGRIAVPTRIVTGDADRLTVPEASERMHRSIPTAALAALTSCGHAGLIEKGKEYDALIADAARLSVQRETPSVER